MNLYHYYEPNGRVAHSQTATSFNKALETAVTLGLPFVEGDGLQYGYVRDQTFIPFPERPSPQHTFDYTLYRWIDPRGMDELRGVAWARIKLARAAALDAGVEVPDLGRFDSDDEARVNLTATYAVLPARPDDWTVGWTRFDDSEIALDKATFTQVALTVLGYANEVHARGRVLRDAIEAATTAAELDAIQWV